jgi:hypothetical protein
MDDTPRRCFVHVGLPKTGTTYLQSILWRSRDELVRQGLSLLPHEDGTPRSVRLMLAVRDRLREGIDPLSRREVLDDFSAQLGRSSTPHVLISQEQLSAATAKQAERMFGFLADFEIHLVVTTRSLARQVPSGWQERIKTRSVWTFGEFATAVARRDKEVADFWRHHDLLDVLRRWGATLPPERVHVVTVPPPRSQPDLLLDRFCGVLGVDPEQFAREKRHENSSLGLVQAELLRRVNVALGDRLPTPRKGYSRAAKSWLAPRVLNPQGGVPPAMPRDLEPWCRATTQEWVDGVRAAGYDVVGDLDELMPDPRYFVEMSSAIDETAVGESAIEALATILDLRAQDIARADKLTETVRHRDAEIADLRQQLESRWPRRLARALSSRDKQDPS